jgi:hypothetical protein
MFVPGGYKVFPNGEGEVRARRQRKNNHLPSDLSTSGRPPTPAITGGTGHFVANLAAIEWPG